MTCKFPGCGKQVAARELCKAHYHQWKKGRPLTPLYSTCTRKLEREPTAEEVERMVAEQMPTMPALTRRERRMLP